MSAYNLTGFIVKYKSGMWHAAARINGEDTVCIDKDMVKSMQAIQDKMREASQALADESHERLMKRLGFRPDELIMVLSSR